ncbi:MAG: hypothetical protein N4A49_10980 [Marinifilaceae bacterium]|jgi:hypothetical protein|nr:hypothetical protein [Marinifilaceae bacterium]
MQIEQKKDTKKALQVEQNSLNDLISNKLKIDLTKLSNYKYDKNDIAPHAEIISKILFDKTDNFHSKIEFINVDINDPKLASKIMNSDKEYIILSVSADGFSESSKRFAIHKTKYQINIYNPWRTYQTDKITDEVSRITDEANYNEEESIENYLTYETSITAINIAEQLKRYTTTKLI